MTEGAPGRLEAGVRASLPFGFLGLLVATTWGLVAEPIIGAPAAIAMSVIAYAGAAQFGVVAVLAVGGDAVAAVVAGILLNTRYIPMSLSLTPSLPRGMLARLGVATTLTDPGWALSIRGDGRFDTRFMVGTFIGQWPLWQLGTILGVLAGSILADAEAFGLDVALPAFFLTVLVGGELRKDLAGITVAALGGFIALALMPVAPPGIPLMAASAAALVILLPPLRRRG